MRWRCISSWDRIEVFSKHQKVADHPRLIDKRETTVTAAGHHEPLHRQRTYNGPFSEEKALTGQHEWLDPFVTAVKKPFRRQGCQVIAAASGPETDLSSGGL